MMGTRFKPLGVLHTCYKEKFGIPRQPNLVAAPGKLLFYPEFAREEAVRGLEGFSHLWVIFLFHDLSGTTVNGESTPRKEWSPMVRPPRLGGNKKVGVFASRSPFRPNPIGMSPVRLESVEIKDNGPVLHLSGVDILDQTLVLDIKPYLPYSDTIPDAETGFAQGPPEVKLKVVFSDVALKQIQERSREIPNLMAIIRGILENDPRPAYRSRQKSNSDATQVYGIRIFDFDLKWRVAQEQALVTRLEPN